MDSPISESSSSSANSYMSFIEASRVKLQRDHLPTFFEAFEVCIAEYTNLWENLYNMDETGNASTIVNT